MIIIFKVIVAGSRSFNDYDLLKTTLDCLFVNQSGTEIVSGTASGADRLGEKYANERTLCLKQFPANWKSFGKRAGYLRNEQMAMYANALVVFWDGKSSGTKHMIELAAKHRLIIRVIQYS